MGPTDIDVLGDGFAEACWGRICMAGRFIYGCITGRHSRCVGFCLRFGDLFDIALPSSATPISTLATSFEFDVTYLIGTYCHCCDDDESDGVACLAASYCEYSIVAIYPYFLAWC